MDSHELRELFEGTPVVINQAAMLSETSPPPVTASDNISTVNKDQMETEDVKLLILPQSPSQKCEDEKQSACGTHSKSNETLWMENNLESGVAVKEVVEDNSCISQCEIIKDNRDPLADDKALQVEDEGENSSVESSSDVNETAKQPAQTNLKRRRVKLSSELWQLTIVKFMKEYYQKNPKENLVKLARAMNRRLKLRWNEQLLSKHVSNMIIKYRDVQRDIDQGNYNWEDDKELIYKRCPYFMEMHEALQFSEFYRNGGRTKRKYTQVRASRRNNLQDKMRTGQEIDSESSSVTVQTEKKPTEIRKPITSHLQYTFIRFMKDYYEKEPGAHQAQIQKAMNKKLELRWTEKSLSNCISSMIRSYRDIREAMNRENCSFEDLDEEFASKKCHFYKELHEALQLSDHYRDNIGKCKSGKPLKIKLANKKPARHSSSSSSSNCREEIDENFARTRIWKKTPMNTRTEPTEDKDKLNSEKSIEKKRIPSEENFEEREILIPTMKSQKWKSARMQEEYACIARFMKEHFKRNPSSSKIKMIKAFKSQTKSFLAELTILKIVSTMIRSYRELKLEIDNLKSCSSAYKKKLISERCPFFDDIHEAYQYSDFYRTSNWELDRRSAAYHRSQTKHKSSTSCTTKSSKDNKNEEYLRVKIAPIECEKQQFVEGKRVACTKKRTQEAPTTTKKPETYKMNTEHKINKRKKVPLDLTPELQILFARFMRNYYKKNPSATQTPLQKTMYKHFNLECSMGALCIGIASMIKTYRNLRHQLGNPDGYSESLKKELKLRRCPYFFEIHDAYQYSDYYRNCNWTPKTVGRPPRKGSRLQNTISNASSDNEMETTDESTVCKASPTHVKHHSNEGTNNTSVYHNLESSIIEKEVMIVIPPLKMHDHDQKQASSDEVAIVTPQLKVADCDHKQDNISEPVEKDKAIVKNPTVVEESKLSSEHQLELIKLEDRKEERQFQMQLTKLQQEYEIMKLKLQIKYERVKNLKQ